MTRPASVFHRLTRGFALIGLIGGLTLITFVSFDVDILLEQHTAGIGWRGKWLEIAEHVVLPLLLLMGPMVVAARLVIRTSLAPLGAAAVRIDAAKGIERGFRIDLSSFPAEALPFGHAVNNLLGRLDDAAGRHEAFAVDVAHELKTPLAILVLELDRLGFPEVNRLKSDIAGMSRLVDQLMVMAQLDADAAAPVAYDREQLDEVAGEVTIRLAPIAASQDKSLELEIIERVTVLGRRETLAAAIRNLIENALRVTPRHGTVTVLVGPGTQVRVRDGGPGLSRENLATLSQRFARADHASFGGAGLGLAIVSRIVEVHSGTFETDPDARELRLAFPNLSNITADTETLE